MNLNRTFLKILPAFAKIPLLVQLHQEEQLHKLLKQINPLLEKITADKEIFWDILDFSPEKAKQVLDQLSSINFLFDAFELSLKQINTREIQTEELKKDFQIFLAYTVSFFNKMKDLTEVLKSVAENKPVDEDSEDYQQFLAEFAEMIQKAQPWQKGSSHSLKESLGI